MTQSITPLGWVFIILFVLFVIGVNVSIFLGFRKQSGRDRWTDRIRDAGVVLRNPWGKEEQRLHELSERVDRLTNKASDENPKNS